MILYLRLFWEFFYTGLFSIGGGLATIPFLQDMGSRTGWFTSQDLANMIAVSESTPGPIGVNMATYVGVTTAGIPGSIIATAGLVTPAIIVIIIISSILRRFQDSKYVGAFFYGLRPASTGLIATACWSVISISLLNIPGWQANGQLLTLIDWRCLLVAAATFLFSMLKPTNKLHPVFWILLSAGAGILFQL